MNKEALCEAFCQSIEIRRVPAGWAVGTPFHSTDGDQIGFFITRSKSSGEFRIEDDGTSVAYLDALGVNMRTGQRAEIFSTLLKEYGLDYDSDLGIIHTGLISEDEIPVKSIQFIAMMLRLQDLSLLHPSTVRSTFEDDARAAINARFGHMAQIRHKEVLNNKMKNYKIDTIIETLGYDPVAIYYGTSENRVNEAVIFWMESRFVQNFSAKVILLLERVKPQGITERALERAMNHLDAVPVYGQDSFEALSKISAMAGLSEKETYVPISH